MTGELIQHVLADPKTGATVAGATIATGVGTWVDWIPDDVGKVATLVGIVLSLVIIYTTLKWDCARRRKIELECQKLQQEIDERKAMAELRRSVGLPTRREEDDLSED